AFSPNGKTLVSARSEKIIQFWDVATGQPLQELRQEERFDSLALSLDGRTLATAGSAGVTVWDVANRKQLGRIAAEGVLAIAVAPDGRTPALGGKDKAIHLWDVATGKEKRRLTGPAAAVHSRQNVDLCRRPNDPCLGHSHRPRSACDRYGLRGPR